MASSNVIDLHLPNFFKEQKHVPPILFSKQPKDDVSNAFFADTLTSLFAASLCVPEEHNHGN